MGRAINTVLLYVGLPLLIIGIVIGMVFQYNLNSNRKALYDITEFCYGDDCKIYEEFIGYGNDICRNVFSEAEGTYLNGKCVHHEEIKGCIKEKGYMECSQEHGAGQPIVDRINKIKAERDKYETDFMQLSSDLNIARETLVELRQSFDSFYPDVFYCYGDGRIEYGYEREEVTKTNITIQEHELLDEYYVEQCAICGVGEEYWIRCHSDNEWYPMSYEESRNCRPCYSDTSMCQRGYIEKTSSVMKPVNVTVNLDEYGYTIIDLSELSHNDRIEVFRQIKDEDCYTTKNLFSSNIRMTITGAE